MADTTPAPVRKVCLISLGCPKNLVDSETILGSLPPEKFQPVTRMEEADVVVVNTCAFLREARREAREAIREAVRERERSGFLLAVAGCLVQYYGKRAPEMISEADLFLGVGEGAELGRMLEAPPAPSGSDCRSRIRPEPRFAFAENRPRLVSTPRHWAYLRIADGCSNRCSYCLIPYLRGPHRERPLPALLEEARSLAGRGVRELILIAQDTARYGYGRGGLIRLLEGLNGIGGLDWVRLLYLHPRHIDGELLRAIASLDRICPYLDIPLQHIDDRVLEKMEREIDLRRIRKVLDLAREKVPGVSLRTTLMVGFPGEGEAEFKRLAEFVRRERFDHLGVFAYSRERGSGAYTLGPGVPGSVARLRRETLMEIQQGISAEKLRGFRGQELEVLLDRPLDGPGPPRMIGHSRFQAPEIDGVTVIEGEGTRPGEMVVARITDSSEYDLRGEVIPGRKGPPRESPAPASSA